MPKSEKSKSKGCLHNENEGCLFKFKGCQHQENIKLKDVYIRGIEI